MKLFDITSVVVIVLVLSEVLQVNPKPLKSVKLTDLQWDEEWHVDGNEQIQIDTTKQKQMIHDKNTTTLPESFVPFNNKVAGHTYQAGKQIIGFLKDEQDGSIIKPVKNSLIGEREIQFYENLQNQNDRISKMLKNLVPEYRGTVKLNIEGENVTFIKLADLTHGMIEPCIMDVKIGNQTWDPLATEEKQNHEKQKYKACRHSLGFCIHGVHVYSVTTGKFERYGSDYAKTLDENTIKDAIRKFLNGDSGLSKQLVSQFKSKLNRILEWAQHQKSLRLYSSSLLLTYDANRLRKYLQFSKISPNLHNSSDSIMENNESNKAVVTQKNIPLSLEVESKILQKNNSTQFNLDKDLNTIHTNGPALNNLLPRNEDDDLAFVSMIDFGHAFPSPDDSVDSNYLLGVDNLVKMFDEILTNSE